jgi:phosphoserine phosphatase
MTTTLFLIRHGESVANKQRIYQGQGIDTGLTEKGRQQAQELKETFDIKTVDAVFSSPTKRTIETAKCIFGTTPEIDPRLIERGMGVWEGEQWDSVQKRWPQEWKEYKTRRNFKNIPRAEQTMEMEHRIIDFCTEKIHAFSEKTVVAVTHYGVIKVILQLLNHHSLEQLQQITIPPTSIITVVFDQKFTDGHIQETLSKDAQTPEPF